MTETAYLVKNVSEVPLMVYDGTDITSTDTARVIASCFKALAKAGLLWRSAGIPTYSSNFRTGSIIVDTTNHDLYISDAGACNKITAS